VKGVESVKLWQDRTMIVPAGHVVKTGYVPIHKIKTACKARMAVGDVSAAFQKRLALGENQSWPPPWGYWCEEEAGFFVVVDGRHEYVACIMLGFETLFVAWVEAVE
jgi:hypothetical protein